MFGALGSIAGAAFGGPVGSMVGGMVGNMVDGGGSGGGSSQESQGFEKALGQFALQIASDGMDEMNQAMSDTDEDFE
jgi:hypothetical protein